MHRKQLCCFSECLELLKDYLKVPQFAKSFRNQNKSRLESVIFIISSYDNLFEKYSFSTCKITLHSLHPWFLKLAIFSLVCSAPQTHIDIQIPVYILSFATFCSPRIQVMEEGYWCSLKKPKSSSAQTMDHQLHVLLYFGCWVKSSRVSNRTDNNSQPTVSCCSQ